MTTDSFQPETDLGTPPVPGAPPVTVTVDGRQVEVPAGTSVLRAAAEAGVPVPKLCATDSLAAFGSCRMCLVEIDGVAGVPASCTTPCADGMVVSTQTETVRTLRQMELPAFCNSRLAISNRARSRSCSSATSTRGMTAVMFRRYW